MACTSFQMSTDFFATVQNTEVGQFFPQGQGNVAFRLNACPPARKARENRMPAIGMFLSASGDSAR